MKKMIIAILVLFIVVMFFWYLGYKGGYVEGYMKGYEDTTEFFIKKPDKNEIEIKDSLII